MGEVRMLIDGELAEAGSGKRFANVNPATEEVLGEVTDADATDMTRAIGAARRAFDDTDWSTNRALRKRCLQQLQGALVSEQEQLRQELVEEAGTPVMMTYGAQLDWPLADALTWPMEYIDEFEWERELPISNQIGLPSRRGVYKEATGVIGAVVPWNFPVEVTLNKLGSDSGDGQHLRAETGARHSFQRNASRAPGRRAHRHSRRGAQRRTVLRPSRWRGPHP
jgi:aldehyde dehydrogenase (NAD+)